MGERPFPTALSRGRHSWGCAWTACSLSCRDHPPGSKEGSAGAACTLSSGRGFTCLLMRDGVNDAVSPPVRTRHPACPCAQSHAAASAQTWHCASLHETWQPWDCQTIFHVPLPGGWAEPRREAGSSARHPAPGTRGGLCWGRWIFPFRQLPCCAWCHGLVLPCLLITAICCPGFNSEPVHTAMVPWHGYSQAPGGTTGMERNRAGRLAPACSTVFPAVRLCKHRDGEPGLTPCVTVPGWLQPWGEPIRPCSSP